MGSLKEKEMVLIQMAKKMKTLYNRVGRSLHKEVKAVQDDGPQKSEEEIRAEAVAIMEKRCKTELKRKAILWKMIEVEDVTKNHMNKAKGMFYGMEFPWTEEGLSL